MNELPDTPRRFIAGARCSQCDAQDRVVLYRRAGVQYRECIECGFVDTMQFEPGFRELETRVNRTEAEKRDAVSVVKLVDIDPVARS